MAQTEAAELVTTEAAAATLTVLVDQAAAHLIEKLGEAINDGRRGESPSPDAMRVFASLRQISALSATAALPAPARLLEYAGDEAHSELLRLSVMKVLQHAAASALSASVAFASIA